jgi:hypothetical protein
MSTCYYMTCHACKKALWVAQDGLSGFTFYSDEPKTMHALGRFLSEHYGRDHPLELASEHRFDDLMEEGYVDVDENAPGADPSANSHADVGQGLRPGPS